jgi:hypothetical protein
VERHPGHSYRFVPMFKGNPFVAGRLAIFGLANMDLCAYEASDFHIIDDDLTCFMMQVKWRYNLKPTPEDWARIETIDEVIDLILAKN